MKIGVVVHGPRIIDSAYALDIIGILSDFGEVHCRLGGTMGRTAVIDAALEDLIDINHKLLPSESLYKFNKEGMDIIFLLNYGKSNTTGHVFGFKVFHHYFDKDINKNIPVVQIERPGESDGTIVIWNGKKEKISLLGLSVEEFVSNVCDLLDLTFISPDEILKKYFSSEFITDHGLISRKIHGVNPNENILVNGVVIGKSLSKDLVLIAKDDEIIDIIGGEIKEHGLSKLGKVDLNKAIIKTGLLRTSYIKPRILTKKNDSNIFKVAFLDHAAEDIYSFNNCDLLISIGDDTTLISSDILYRFDIPIIGITDGDLDQVVLDSYKKKESIIFQVESGYDDELGLKIFDEIFNKELFIEFSLEEYSKNDILQYLKDEIIKIINNMKCKYEFK